MEHPGLKGPGRITFKRKKRVSGICSTGNDFYLTVCFFDIPNVLLTHEFCKHHISIGMQRVQRIQELRIPGIASYGK